MEFQVTECMPVQIYKLILGNATLFFKWLYQVSLQHRDESVEPQGFDPDRTASLPTLSATIGLLLAPSSVGGAFLMSQGFSGIK